MIIDKSFSKSELVEIINELNLRITHSHADNKKELQDKIIEHVKKKNIKIDDDNMFNIKTRDGLIFFLTNKNPKKTLNIKEKQQVMNIAKNVINYCKRGYCIEFSTYDNFKDLCDDVDFIKQFGDIPSCRRACKLMNKDDKVRADRFLPLISPQVQRQLNEKKILKQKYSPYIIIRHSTPDNRIIITFD